MRNEKCEIKAIRSDRKKCNNVENDLSCIRPLPRENDLNEPSDQAIDLGTRSGRIESIGEKGSEKPCWLGEANNGNVKRKKEISGKNIKLPSSKSLHLLREGNNMLNKTKHAKYTLDRLREYEKRLAIHGDFECYTNNN